MNKRRHSGDQKKPLNTESKSGSDAIEKSAPELSVEQNSADPEDSDADADAMDDIHDKAMSADRYWWWSGC